MTTYLLKLLLCSGFLLMVYVLFLQSEKMYRFNRFYLLFSIVFSFAVPLMMIEDSGEMIPFAETVMELEESLTPGPGGEQMTAKSINVPTPVTMFFVLWCVVSGVLIIRFLRNLVVLLRNEKGQVVRVYQGVKLVLVPSTILPYSFLGRVYVSRKEYEAGQVEKEILQHEVAHIQQRHSIDILFLELVSCVAWFNPFFYGYKKAIQLNHEFLADKAVLDTYPNTTAYQHLLLNKITLACRQPLASSFYYLTTKKRLIMMLKTNSPYRTLAKQIAMLPLFASLLFVFSSRLQAQQDPLPPTASSRTVLYIQPKDTTKFPVWVGEPIAFTQEGVPDNQLQEYKRIIARYKSPDGKFTKESSHMLSEDKDRLESIFRQMNKAQQAKQEVMFLKPIKPMPMKKPTAIQLESFKKASLYGVWIDGKKVSNGILDQFQPGDFSHFFISKLYGAARKGRSYTHQVDLMTNAYYKDYYNRRISNEESVIVIRRGVNK